MKIIRFWGLLLTLVLLKFGFYFWDTPVKSAALFFEIERGRQDLLRPARLARTSMPRKA